jgi:uncharacterized protein YjiS (DUF1127 family)
MVEKGFTMSVNLKTYTAHSGYEVPETTDSTAGIRHLYRRLADWSKGYRAYHETLRELNGLSDRELADIGIARVDIPAIARGMARPQRASR